MTAKSKSKTLRAKAARSSPEPTDSESVSWRAIAFRSDEASSETPWSPLRLCKSNSPCNNNEDTSKWVGDQVLGAYYAMQMIEHLRDHGVRGDPQSGSRLQQVAEAICRSGHFGTVEWMFFMAIGEFIATGEITVSSGFAAVPWKGESVGGAS